MGGLPSVQITEDDVHRAFEKWGCNCGPGALAAACDLTLDQVRPLIPDFELKHYTSPTMMQAGIANAGWRVVSVDSGPCLDVNRFPEIGLVRIQWEGPWRGLWAYSQTHWIASRRHDGALWIFDINCGWQLSDVWRDQVAPGLIANDKRRTGWHASHRWGLARIKLSQLINEME